MLGLYHKRTSDQEEARMPETEKSLADILGTGEEQHPLTTSVDALLDDDTSINAQNYAQEHKIDFQLFDDDSAETVLPEGIDDVALAPAADDDSLLLENGDASIDLEDLSNSTDEFVQEEIPMETSEPELDDTETVVQDPFASASWDDDEAQGFVPSVPLVHSYEEDDVNNSDPAVDVEDEEPEVVEVEAVYGRPQFSLQKSVLRRVKHNTGPYFEVKNITADFENVCYRIHENNGSEMWMAESGRPYLKLDVVDKKSLKKWALCLFDEFDVALGATDTELHIPKAADAVRFAHFMQGGHEKLCIYNQENYRFVVPLDEHFSFQNGVVYGHLDDNTSIHVCDFIDVPLTDKFGSVLEFSRPMNGRLQGPKGMVVYFADVKGIVIGHEGEKDTETRPFTWENRLADREATGAFVFSEDSAETEFIGSAKTKILQVKVNDLYGWNVRFDNNVCMSLRDALVYQTKYNKLPDTKGKLLFGNKCLHFVNIVKIVPDVKRIYFSYGKKK